MKFLFNVGHGNGDPGAIGHGYQEYELAKELCLNVESILKSKVEIDVYPTNRNLYRDIINNQVVVDIKNYDYLLSFHINAAAVEATGCEALVHVNEAGVSVEVEILQKLAQFYKNRGIKRRSDLALLNYTKNKGISACILETFFISNKKDIDVYLNNKLSIANAIAEGVTLGFGLNEAIKSEYTGPSIVMYLNSINQDSSFTARKKLAKKYQIPNYQGSASQNTLLLSLLKNQSYYPRFDDVSIVNGLNSIGVNSSFDYRTKIALVNGIENYQGTTSQNNKLCMLARQGKLIQV